MIRIRSGWVLAALLSFSMGCGGKPRVELGAGAFASCNPLDGGTETCQGTAAALGGGASCAFIDDGSDEYLCVAANVCATATCPSGWTCVLGTTGPVPIVGCHVK